MFYYLLCRKLEADSILVFVYMYFEVQFFFKTCSAVHVPIKRSASSNTFTVEWSSVSYQSTVVSSTVGVTKVCPPQLVVGYQY